MSNSDFGLDSVSQFLKYHTLEPHEVDCSTAVMLKILDGKCKMPEDEKRIMTHLYKAVRHLPGHNIDNSMHALIDDMIHRLSLLLRDEDKEELKLFIYEKRLLAESAISRPVMKAFKGRIRKLGLFSTENSEKHHVG